MYLMKKDGITFWRNMEWKDGMNTRKIIGILYSLLNWSSQAYLEPEVCYIQGHNKILFQFWTQDQPKAVMS